MPDHLLDLAVMLRADADLQEQVLMSRLAGRLGYLAVHLPVAPSASVDSALVERLIAAAAPAAIAADGLRPIAVRFLTSTVAPPRQVTSLSFLTRAGLTTDSPPVL